MAQETNQTQGPMLCTTGCGFYGNQRTNGMCSVCYKDYLQRQNNNGRVSPSAPSGVGSAGEPLSTQCSENSVVLLTPTSHSAVATLEPSSVISSQNLPPASVAQSEEDSSTGDRSALRVEHLQASVLDVSERVYVEDEDPSCDRPKQKRSRCFACRKKVGLTGFDCRCGHVFCSMHRYSDVHGCTFDYKADAAEKIRKDNPVVVGEKIQKI